jgi:hypothetical protein
MNLLTFNTWSSTINSDISTLLNSPSVINSATTTTTTSSDSLPTSTTSPQLSMNQMIDINNNSSSSSSSTTSSYSSNQKNVNRRPITGNHFNVQSSHLLNKTHQQCPIRKQNTQLNNILFDDNTCNNVTLYRPIKSAAADSFHLDWNASLLLLNDNNVLNTNNNNNNAVLNSTFNDSLSFNKYSRKVFIGGLPSDIDESNVNFKSFFPLLF